MDYKFLPPNKLYSPIGVLELFKKAVAHESDDVQAVFDKADYKSLIELWYASALAVAIFKWTGDKFLMYPSDSPDVHFVKANKTGKQEVFSVEIMTLFNFEQKVFDGNYQQLAKTVWDKKGGKDYDRAELMLVSRLTARQINVDSLAQEINKFKWKFPRIWLSMYSESSKSWTLFEIQPYPEQGDVGKITVGLTELPY